MAGEDDRALQAGLAGPPQLHPVQPGDADQVGKLHAEQRDNNRWLLLPRLPNSWRLSSPQDRYRRAGTTYSPPLTHSPNQQARSFWSSEKLHNCTGLFCVAVFVFRDVTLTSHKVSHCNRPTFHPTNQPCIINRRCQQCGYYLCSCDFCVQERFALLATP